MQGLSQSEANQMIDKTKFRALSVHRPWDQAIYNGKDFENRIWQLPDWAKNVPIALHAGQKYDQCGADWMLHNNLYTPHGRGGSPMGITGIVMFSECVEVTSTEHAVYDNNHNRLWWLTGPYGWRISAAIQLNGRVECNGLQRFWHVPETLFSKINDSLPRPEFLSKEQYKLWLKTKNMLLGKICSRANSQ
jgi:hypothetical protein